MKTFVFDNNYAPAEASELVSWYFLADSSLTNAGKPFFIPDFAKEFEAIPVIAVRINRLGKSIASKFGGRYYTEFAPAVHFRAKDLLHRLRDLQLPAARACSFDRSFIMGDFRPFPEAAEAAVVMKKNGETVSEFKSVELLIPVNETIAKASYADTLKIGDLIVPGLPKGTYIAIDDILELSIDGDTVLTVQIK